MSRWVKRIRGAVGMGLTWAAAWAAVGLLTGVTSVLLPNLPWWDALFRFFDAPLPALGVPGFVGGALFSGVLGIAGRRRRFDELSMPRFTAWGAAAGLLLSVFPFAIGTPSAGTSPWVLLAVISGPLTLLCAASAAGSLALARIAERRELMAAGAAADAVGLADDEVRELLDGRG